MVEASNDACHKDAMIDHRFRPQQKERERRKEVRQEHPLVKPLYDIRHIKHDIRHAYIPFPYQYYASVKQQCCCHAKSR